VNSVGRTRRVLAIDPGYGGTGWALFHDEKWHSCGIITAPKTVGDPDLNGRAHYITAQLHVICKRNAVGRVLIEMPAFFQSSGGQLAAGSGALVKLTFLVGYINAVLRRRRPQLVPVSQWKGNLPKHVVERRVKRILGEGTVERNKIKDHAMDAVGIGLWYFGYAMK
jgi:Holliday junction resolvasome RuvABC endonuclease subunit